MCFSFTRVTRIPFTLTASLDVLVFSNEHQLFLVIKSFKLSLNSKWKFKCPKLDCYFRLYDGALQYKEALDVLALIYPAVFLFTIMNFIITLKQIFFFSILVHKIFWITIFNCHANKPETAVDVFVLMTEWVHSECAKW